VEPTREQVYQQRIAELEAQVVDLKAQIGRLAEQVAKLSKIPQLFQSHRPATSSKPPKLVLRGHRRKIGGQPGHPKHGREPFGPEELDDTRQYRLDHCPDCGGKLRPSQADDRWSNKSRSSSVRGDRRASQ